MPEIEALGSDVVEADVAALRCNMLVSDSLLCGQIGFDQINVDQIRSAMRSLAERLRGLTAISSGVAITGFRVINFKVGVRSRPP